MRNWHFNHIDFSTYPGYQQHDLGVFWDENSTSVKIWAPTASQVEMKLYYDGVADSIFKKINLQLAENGCWETTLAGNYEGIFYTFRVNDGEWLHETPDIYCRCVGVNGQRGMIFDPSKTNPDNWQTDKGPRLNSFVEAVIYEIHVRDFSIFPGSGITNKGKYLGFTEFNTVNNKNFTTGISHLKELGITHVHLLPVNDFATVDEENPLEKYNWGYDPLHFNVPEGSYSTNPFDGRVRIKEFKQLVQTLHSQGIGVIVDVVYNHTYFTKESAFNQVVPGYFYRQKPDGSFANASGCGNELASEREMVRKFMVDSLKYWVEEYHIDGFRFDLMGIFDLTTMKTIQDELFALKPEILLYGEGWTADVSPLPEMYRAVKMNISQLPGIGIFNDDFRDALKGNHGNKRSKGFVSGLVLREEAIKFGITGAVWHPQIIYNYVETSNRPWAVGPNQCVNYVSCHDNFTLWDKLFFSLPKATDDELRSSVKLAGALVLTSQGAPFLEGGIEFCRTKGGNGNSYKSPDAVNQLDWDRKSVYHDVFLYFKKLIEIRKKHPAFRMKNAPMIAANIDFCLEYRMGVVGYCINGTNAGDSWKKILVIFNGNRSPAEMNIPEGKFTLVASGNEIDEKGLGAEIENKVTIAPVSMSMLAIF